MNSFLATEQELREWLYSLGQEHLVWAPQKAGQSSYRWLELSQDSKIDFGNREPSIVPPGKKLNPAREKLFSYKLTDDGVQIESGAKGGSQILAGVNPCDLKAISLMDKVYTTTTKDPNYLEKRKHTLIIAWRCNKPCDESCFCEATGSLYHTKGADVTLTPLRDKILVEALTEEGKNLLKSVSFAPCSDPEMCQKEWKASLPKPFGRHWEAPVEEVAELMKKAWNSSAWQTHIQNCFNCGTCTLVCPTCYCFGVHDEMDLDAKGGERTRNWDSCMLPNFATVAGNHNFRETAEARQRHRVNRKFNYLNTRLDEGPGCVGCGRCGRQCTTGIDIFDIVSDIVKEGRAK